MVGGQDAAGRGDRLGAGVRGRPVWSTRVLWLALAIAAGIRLALVAMQWPVINSDEATLGLMAWHIAEGRRFPVFFYGQQYMGSIVAYAAAPVFWLVGPSAAGLRLVTTALFLGFLGALWKLTAMLYDRRVAAVTVLLLAFGSISMVAGQLQADGHNATRLLAVLVLLLAVALARGSQQDVALPPRRRWLWAGWGLVAGLGLWTDLLVVPFLGASAMVLLACCRSGSPWRIGWAVGGALLGISPMLADNLLAPGAGTLDQVLGMVGGRADPRPEPSLGGRLWGALTVSLPMATGASAVCPGGIPAAWRTPGMLDLPAPQCAGVYLGWGLAVLALLALGLWRALRGVWAQARRGGARDDRRRWADAVARLALVGAAVATLAIYAGSSPAGLSPYSGSRYLQGIWVGLPAVVAAFVSPGPPRAADRVPSPRRFAATVPRSVVGVTLCGGLLLGTGQLVSHARQPHPWLVQQEALLDNLLRAGMTRVYTDYWTCNVLAFASRERVVCAVLNDDLTAGFDRVRSYRTQVTGAPQAWYVFRDGSPPVRALARDTGMRRVAHVAGYAVFGRSDRKPPSVRLGTVLGAGRPHVSPWRRSGGPEAAGGTTPE
jgi:hypothetical protein